MNITIGGRLFELTSEVSEKVEELVDQTFGNLDRAWRLFVAQIQHPQLKVVNYAEFVGMSNAIRNSGEFSPSSIQPVGVQGSKGDRNAPKKDSRQPLKSAEITAFAPLGSKANRKPRFRM